MGSDVGGLKGAHVVAGCGCVSSSLIRTPILFPHLPATFSVSDSSDLTCHEGCLGSKPRAGYCEPPRQLQFGS